MKPVRSSESPASSDLIDSSSECGLSMSEYDTDFDVNGEYKAIMLKGTMLSIEKNPKLLLGIPKKSYFCLQILADKTSLPIENILITPKKIRLDEPYTILGMQFGRSSANQICDSPT